MLVIVVAGCGTNESGTFGTLPLGVQDESSSSLKAGIYTGSLTCTETDYIASIVVNQFQTRYETTAIIDESGVPLEGGVPVAPGVVAGFATGELSLTRQVTNVAVSDNGVVIAFDSSGSQSGICLDSCDYAFDGECDDGGPGAINNVCLYGTDCSDCGQIPQILAGSGTMTYKRYGADRLEYRSSLVGSFSNEFASGDVRIECVGVLVP